MVSYEVSIRVRDDHRADLRRIHSIRRLHRAGAADRPRRTLTGRGIRLPQLVLAAAVPDVRHLLCHALAEPPSAVRSGRGGIGAWSPASWSRYGSTPYVMFMLAEYWRSSGPCALAATIFLFLGGLAVAIPSRRSPACRRDRFTLKVLFIFFMFAMVKAIRAALPLRPFGTPSRLKLFLPLLLAIGGDRRRRWCNSASGPAHSEDVDRLDRAAKVAVPRRSSSSAMAARRCATSSSRRRRSTIRTRRDPQSPQLPRRTCAAPLPQRRGALHRLQAVRGDLSGRRSPSKPIPAVTTARGARRATTSTWSNASIAGCARRPARSTPSSRARISNSPPRRARSFTTTDRLLANGDRWEREIAKNLALTALVPVD